MKRIGRMSIIKKTYIRNRYNYRAMNPAQFIPASAIQHQILIEQEIIKACNIKINAYMQLLLDSEDKNVAQIRKEVVAEKPGRILRKGRAKREIFSVLDELRYPASSLVIHKRFDSSDKKKLKDTSSKLNSYHNSGELGKEVIDIGDKTYWVYGPTQYYTEDRTKVKTEYRDRIIITEK
jgi:hypothetical protein